MDARYISICVISCLLSAAVVSSVWAAPRFDPEVECTRQELGPYPWSYLEIVKGHIERTFFDPHSVIDLEIFKPSPGWWTTAVFKLTRNNTECYWYIPYRANGKNRMGGYVGRKAYGIWVKRDTVFHSSERTAIPSELIERGEAIYEQEFEKLTDQQKEQALELALDQGKPQDTSLSYLQELRELAELRDAGIISEEEFQKKKAQVLGIGDEESGDS